MLISPVGFRLSGEVFNTPFTSNEMASPVLLLAAFKVMLPPAAAPPEPVTMPAEPMVKVRSRLSGEVVDMVILPPSVCINPVVVSAPRLLMLVAPPPR